MAVGPQNLPGLVNVYRGEALVGHFLQEETINEATCLLPMNPELLIVLMYLEEGSPPPSGKGGPETSGFLVAQTS